MSVLLSRPLLLLPGFNTYPRFFAIFRYGDVEQELQELSRPQGYSLDDVVELVRINEETMDMMRVSVSFFV